MRFASNTFAFLLAFLVGFGSTRPLTTSATQPSSAEDEVRSANVQVAPPQPFRSEVKSTEIVAGQSVGFLSLGDNRQRAIELFGRPDTEYDYDNETKLDCSRNTKELRFWELYDKSSPFFSGRGNGAWVYLRDDKIFQIKIQSDKFATKDGITVMSDPKKVKRLYPNSEAWVEINTQCDCTGGQNLIYWIDKGSGIAFEFHYHQKLRKKYLAYVFVFEPNTAFLPDGCVFLETQAWEQLPPFILTEPRSMQENWEKEFASRHQKS